MEKGKRGKQRTEEGGRLKVREKGRRKRKKRENGR